MQVFNIEVSLYRSIPKHKCRCFKNSNITILKTPNELMDLDNDYQWQTQPSRRETKCYINICPDRSAINHIHHL